MVMGRAEGVTFFPCHLDMSIPTISRQGSCLGICSASQGAEAHIACLEMTGGAKVALRTSDVREGKLGFGVIYQIWRQPHVTVVFLVLLLVTVCLTLFMSISFLA